MPQILEANNYRFYEREKSLNEYRDYLVKLIEEKDAKQSVRDLALRLLILIANLRESGEDYLTAYNLIVKHQMKIDLRSELIVNSDLAQCVQKPKEEEEKTDESLEQPEVREEFTLEQKPEGFKYCQASEVISIRELKESIDDIDNCNEKLKFAFSDDCIYVDIAYEGIYKFGFKESTQTIPGKLYAKNREEQREKYR